MGFFHIPWRIRRLAGIDTNCVKSDINKKLTVNIYTKETFLDDERFGIFIHWETINSEFNGFSLLQKIND